MDKVVHLEIPVKNIRKPIHEMDYIIVRTVPSDKIGMPKEAGAINVDNENESSDKVTYRDYKCGGY